MISFFSIFASKKLKPYLIAAMIAVATLSTITLFKTADLTGIFTVETGIFLKKGIHDPMFLKTMPASSLFVPRDKMEWSENFKQKNSQIYAFFLILLCIDIARRLGGARSAWLSGLIALFSLSGDIEQKILAITMLFFIDVACWRMGRESRSNAIIAGLALGASFLIRSDAISFPFIYAAYEIFFTKGAPKEKIIRAGLIAVFSGAILIPWAVLSWKILGYPILFELNRADCNIISSALGSIYTVEGNFRALAGLSPSDSVYMWAIHHILQNPLTYILSIIQRIWNILIMNPSLLIAAAASFIITKNKKGAGFLILLSGAFILSHALLSIEPRYFYPLWLMLTPCIALLPSKPFPSQGNTKTFDLPIIIGAIIISVFLLYVETIVIRAAFFGTRISTALKQLSNDLNPNPILLKYAIEKSLMKKDIDNAMLFLSKSANKGSIRDKRTFEILKSTADIARPTIEWPVTYSEYSIQLFKELELNNIKNAKSTLKRLQKKWSEKGCLARGASRGLDIDIEKKLRANDTNLQDRYLTQALLFWPDDIQLKLLKKLETIIILTPKLKLTKAKLLAQTGKLNRAKHLLNELEKELKDEETIFNAVMLYNQMGDAKKAGTMLEKYLARTPEAKNKERIIIGAIISNRYDIALKLSNTESQNFLLMNYPEKEVQCGILKAINDKGRSHIYANTATAQLSLRRKTDAAATAKCGMADNITDEERMSLGIIFQDAGLPQRAAEIFKNLSAKHPENHTYLYYAGIAEIMSGDFFNAKKNLSIFLKRNSNDKNAISALKFANENLNKQKKQAD